MSELDEVLLEKAERMERLNDIIVNLAAGVADISGGLSFKDQCKYVSIGEFHYLMDVTGRSKAYGKN